MTSGKFAELIENWNRSQDPAYGDEMAEIIEKLHSSHCELLDCLKTLQNRARGKKLNYPNQKLFNRIETAITKAEAICT